MSVPTWVRLADLSDLAAALEDIPALGDQAGRTQLVTMIDHEVRAGDPHARLNPERFPNQRADIIAIVTAVLNQPRTLPILAKAVELLAPGLPATATLHDLCGRVAERVPADRRTRGHRVTGRSEVGADPRTWWSRSGYIEQVREIAPTGGVRDRDRELAELAAFCAGPDRYVWWQAGPWAGKSALMATFVLDPPEGVTVVSFFVTARLLSQADSNAFVDAMIDQLSALMDQPPQQLLTASARHTYWRALLKEAVELAREAGSTLVLLVDGLDEDRGAAPGSGMASIASLLPKQPSDALRIIVSGRPSPTTPADVPADHALHSCPIRVLAQWPYAPEIARLATRELDDLLAGDRVHRDVIGFVAASGGGLTVTDLEELCGLARYELDRLFMGVFGRTIAGRPHDHLTAYTFTHDTLRSEAIGRLGGALEGYRDRLHQWADRYRAQGWPDSTPAYLLHGYPRALHAARDTERLVALAIDPIRADLLFRVAGGDADAFAVIEAAQDLVLEQDEPDLTSMVRLSLRRAELVARNANIPPELPSVWVVLDQPLRAEALALGMAQSRRQTEALTAAMEASAAVGDFDRAEAFALNISDSQGQDQARRKLAATIAAAGDHRRAEIVVSGIARLDLKVSAMVDLIGELHGSDDPQGLEDVVGRAHEMACAISDPTTRSDTFIALARASASAGKPDLAMSLVDAVPFDHPRAMAFAALAGDAGDRDFAATLISSGVSIAASISSPYGQRIALTQLACAAISAGDPQRAAAIPRHIRDVAQRDRALADVATALAKAGKTSLAETVARTVVDPKHRVEALASVARGAFLAGERRRAGSLVEAIDAALPEIVNPYDRSHAAVVLVRAVAPTGDIDTTTELASAAEGTIRSIANEGDRDSMLALLADELAEGEAWTSARAVVLAIENPYQRDHSLVWLVKAMGRAGAYDLAEDVVREVADPANHVSALGYLIGSLVADQRHDRARAFIRTGVDVARDIAEPSTRARTLADLVTTALAAGDFASAVEIAGDIPVAADRARALCLTARAFADSGADEQAAALANDAESVARGVVDHEQDERALAALVKAAAIVGDYSNAEVLARQLTDRRQRADALTALANGLATARRFETAQDIIARNLNDPRDQASALITVLDAAVAANAREGTSLADHTEAVAAEISRPGERTLALAALIEALAPAGERNRLDRLAHVAVDTALSPSDEDEDYRTYATTTLAESLAMVGDHSRLEAIADHITKRRNPQYHLLLLVQSFLVASDIDRAETAARSFAELDMRAIALSAIAEGIAESGDPERAAPLAQLAEETTRDIPVPRDRAYALTAVAEAVAATGDRQRAIALVDTVEALADDITDPIRRSDTMAELARTSARIGDFTRAQHIASKVTDPNEQVRALINVVELIGQSGDHTLARAVAERAGTVSDSIAQDWRRAQHLTSLAKAIATSGAQGQVTPLADHAAAVARLIENPDQRASALFVLAEVSGAEQGRRLVAEALCVAHWSASLVCLASVDPHALRVVVAHHLGTR